MVLVALDLWYVAPPLMREFFFRLVVTQLVGYILNWGLYGVLSMQVCELIIFRYSVL